MKQILRKLHQSVKHHLPLLLTKKMTMKGVFLQNLSKCYFTFFYYLILMYWLFSPIMPVTTCEINSAPKPKGPSPPKPKHLPPANNPPKPEHLPKPEYLPKSDEEQTEVKKPSPQRDEKNEVDSGFSLITKTSKDYIKDPRKRAFFTSSTAANSWSKPTSTSTPTNTSPAVKAVTLDHSDTLKNE